MTLISTAATVAVKKDGEGTLETKATRGYLQIILPLVQVVLLTSFVALGGAPAPLCHIGSPL